MRHSTILFSETVQGVKSKVSSQAYNENNPKIPLGLQQCMQLNSRMKITLKNCCEIQVKGTPWFGGRAVFWAVFKTFESHYSFLLQLAMNN